MTSINPSSTKDHLWILKQSIAQLADPEQREAAEQALTVLETNINDANSTVWRLTEVDFACVLLDKGIVLEEGELEELLDTAHNKFSIDSWSEHVGNFIDFNR